MKMLPTSYLVIRSLKYNKEKITNNLLAIIKSILAMDMSGIDAEKLRAQIETIEDKRTKLIDIYMSGDITKEEFTEARSQCDAEIAELQSAVDSRDKQQAMVERKQELVRAITEAIHEIVDGVEYEDAFYTQLLDKMVIHDKDNIDVYLNLLPVKWSYTVGKVSESATGRNISGTSVPISVNNPFSSG